jgi:hypothetical protein
MTEDHTTYPSRFLGAAAEKCSARFGDSGDEMYAVFIVVSEGSDGEHVARTVYAASEDDARTAHQENYADETIVAVHRETIPASENTP